MAVNLVSDALGEDHEETFNKYSKTNYLIS